jgi:hypothetical protein
LRERVRVRVTFLSFNTIPLSFILSPKGERRVRAEFFTVIFRNIIHNSLDFPVLIIYNSIIK